MHRTVVAAKRHGVAIGAHPSLPDRQGFGRREMAVSPEEAYQLVLYQLGALSAFARALDWPLRHLKPHGALYTMAAGDRAMAGAIAQATADFDPRLVLFGLAGSALVTEGRARGLRVAEEFFADRAYQADGRLVPRGLAGAVLHDPEQVAARVIEAVTRGRVKAIDGSDVAVKADTVCLHGDTPDAVAFGRTLRATLNSSGLRVAPVGEWLA
jgi:UPF0271 protein